MLKAGVRILVIEDEVIFRHQLVAYMESQGAIVFQADDGIEGMAAAALHQPDVVLCDLKMPAMDGHEVLACLVARYPELPIIVISAMSRLSVVLDVLRAGARDFFAKPLHDWKRLCSCINGCLNDEPESELQSELSRHQARLRQDDLLASRLVAGACPSLLDWGAWQVQCQGEGNLFLVEPFKAGDRLLLVVMALPLDGPDGVFCAMLVRILMNTPYRQYLRGESRLLEHPGKLLAYLNWHLVESGIRQPISVAALLLDQEEYLLFANAGLTAPHWLTNHGGLPLGLLRECDYPVHRRSWHTSFSLKMSSEVGGALDLCVRHG